MKRVGMAAMFALVASLPHSAWAQFYEAAAPSGMPGTAGSAPYWSVIGSGMVGNAGPNAYWIVPLTYVSTSPGSRTWTAWVWVSDTTKCRLYSVPEGTSDDVGTAQSGDLVTAVGAGQIRVTMTTTNTAVYLSCYVPHGGWIGNVIWTY